MARAETEIQELTCADVELVRELWGTLLEHHQNEAAQLSPLGRRLTLDESWAIRRAQYLDWFENGQGRLWLARRHLDDTTETVGYCFVHLGDGSSSWDWGPTVGVLETLVVSANARGLGLGSQLFARARAYFAESGAGVLKVSVIAGNEGALRLYRRMGAVDHLVTLAMRINGVGA